MPEGSAQAAVQSRELQADLKTQLLAQKTHLISELAAAIDNQFNNIMMSVTSYAELELRKASPTARRSLEQVLSNAGRATQLIQKLLAFSRTRATSPRLVQLNDVIQEISELLQQLVSERIEIVLDLQPDLPKIKADPVDLEELLLSLAIHARNAMAAGGKFVLSTKPMEVDHATTKEKLVPGKYVSLSVCDSASPKQTPNSNHMSTPQDLRISLTLSAVNEIVKQANGLIRIAAAPEQGTNFTIYFPANECEVVEEATEIPDKALTASRTIMVVEDDDAVRIPAAEFLKMEGFKVLQAKNGPEAVNIALQKRSPLDLLITDIVMPTMGGREVAKELVALHPGLKVLYMSGDASQAPGDKSRNAGDVLQKPFRLDKLNEKIHLLLGE
jgi:two-component system, cell cycle sensor histidine kinase and response regulator CckA